MAENVKRFYLVAMLGFALGYMTGGLIVRARDCVAPAAPKPQVQAAMTALAAARPAPPDYDARWCGAAHENDACPPSKLVVKCDVKGNCLATMKGEDLLEQPRAKRAINEMVEKLQQGKKQ
jgi:hypothetical protein